MRFLNKYFPYFVILCIIISWFIGKSEKTDDSEIYLKKAMPNGVVFKPLAEDVFSVYNSNNIFAKPSGYIAIAEATGYSGIIKLSISIDTKGVIRKLNIIHQTETPSFFARLDKYDYYSQYIGKKTNSNFQLGKGIDGVTGSTVSCVGISQAVKKASIKFAEAVPGFSINNIKKSRIQINLREIMLIITFFLGYLILIRKLPYKKTFRWITIFISLTFIGFLYATPMSITDINTILLGNFPNIYTHAIWYILIIGVYLPIIIWGINPYFSHICPFGGAQEILGYISKPKLKIPRKIGTILQWLPRFLSLGIIMFALISRNQGFYGHEIFGTAFTLKGNIFEYILLISILILSLFIKRPWCRFLCPVKPTIDSVNWGRNVIMKLKKRKD